MRGQGSGLRPAGNPEMPWVEGSLVAAWKGAWVREQSNQVTPDWPNWPLMETFGTTRPGASPSPRRLHPRVDSPLNSLWNYTELIDRGHCSCTQCAPRDCQHVQTRLQQDRPQTAARRPPQAAVRRPRLQGAAIPTPAQLLRDAAHRRHHPRAVRTMGDRPPQRYKHQTEAPGVERLANYSTILQSSPSSRHARFATSPTMRPPPT